MHRKRVSQLVLDDLPIPTAHQKVAKILENQGNGLHLVETEFAVQLLVKMPPKFRNLIFIKRGCDQHC